MTNSKRREPRDRLSELPDSLIFHIFWFLAMDDFVRTAVLSSRWKTLWTTTPYLNFRFSTFYGNGNFEPRDFINRALLSWRGTMILKFRIDFPYPEWDGDYDEPLRIDFDLWVRFAVEKKVEELYFSEDRFDQSICEYKMPQCLHSCSSLRVLLIPGCYIQSYRNLQWSQLKSLTMDGGSMDDCEHVINHILCGTQLEVLVLTSLNTSDNLSIRSSSLRKLVIEAFSSHLPGELRIWAPNLETLDISGEPYKKCMLMNVSSLTHASLGFYDEPVEIHREDFSGDDFLGETLRQIFPSIQHVQMVRSMNWSIKVLEHMTNVDLVSPFLIMFLNIKEYDEEYEDVFEIFPKLKMLVLLDEDECQPSLKFDIESGLKLVP